MRRSLGKKLTEIRFKLLDEDVSRAIEESIGATQINKGINDRSKSRLHQTDDLSSKTTRPVISSEARAIQFRDFDFVWHEALKNFPIHKTDCFKCFLYLTLPYD